jgi:single-stranded DNA-specific DHH superfamily exonuclease
MDPKSKFKSFVKSLSKEDHIAIIHHMDTDGICSTVIMSRALERLEYKVERLMGSSYYMFSYSHLKALRDEGINKLIFLDIAVDQFPNIKQELELFDAVLVVDHHKTYKNINAPQITLVKAEYLNPKITGSDYCATHMVFDLMSEVVDISDLDWIVAVGMITDITDAKQGKFLGRMYKKYKTTRQQLLAVGVVIDAGKQANPPQVDRAREMVLMAESYKDILTSPFSKIAKGIKNEIDFWVNKFEEKAENKKDIWLYEIDPGASVIASVSTVLALKYPEYSIIVVHHYKDRVSISARNHLRKRAMNTLLEKAVKGFKGANAGGHVPAAGAGIREKDYAEFKKRIWKMA